MRREVALGVDSNFHFAALHLIRAGERHKDPGVRIRWTIFFFWGDLDPTEIDAAKGWFAARGLNVHYVGVEADTLFDSRRWLTRATFLKLRAAENIEGEFLWLDADTFPIANWSQIWSEVPKSSEFAAVRQHEVSEGDKTSPEFNAGVMVFNSNSRKPWRQILECLPTERHSSDQVLFNSMYPSYYELPKEYNSIWGRLVTDVEKFSRPRIVHYGGAFKPWHLNPAFRSYCIRDRCVWQPYLESLESFEMETREDVVLRKLAKRARQVGRVYLKRDGMGRVMSNMLALSLPFSIAIVALMRLFSNYFPPQALHPVHATQGVWKW